MNSAVVYYATIVGIRLAIGLYMNHRKMKEGEKIAVVTTYSKLQHKKA